MKNIFAILLLTIINGANAQVIIGDAVGTAATKTSVLLEFASNQNKGIILPYVRTTLPAASETNRGTILLDANTATNARMKYSNGTTWVDLSGQNGNVTTALSTQPTVANAPELNTSKAVIGASGSAAEGVLVLESATKAMVLPQVADVQNIINPSPGMMVYVTKAGAKRLAVFNGTKWSFWEQEILIIPTVTTATGRVWMDRNLGAAQVATSPTDAASFGDLYQWGRLTDGHEKRNSPNSALNATSSTDVPGNGNFIITDSGNSDWRSPQNSSLWQGVNGTNNPCPSGFRLPTQNELNEEFAFFSPPNATGAFNSPLKLPSTTFRNTSGNFESGNYGIYWTSTAVLPTHSYMSSLAAGSGYMNRGNGFSVRCIKH